MLPEAQDRANLELELPLTSQSLHNTTTHSTFVTPFSAAAGPTDMAVVTTALASSQTDEIQRSSSLFLRNIPPTSGIEIYSFGRGDQGQLGTNHNSLEDCHVPTPISVMNGRDIVSTSASHHSAAITMNGEVYMWGSNDQFQCLKKAEEIISEPTRVEALDNFNIAGVACGSNHTLAFSCDGSVFAWGAADSGQLGLSGDVGSVVKVPKLIKGQLKEHGAQVVRVAAGGSHSLALSHQGTVYSFGSSLFGVLGRDDDAEETSIPRQIASLWPLGVIQIACGESHSAVLTVDGSVYTFGRGKHGQLGHGDFSNQISIPKRVKALEGTVIKQLTCGGDHTVVLTTTGRCLSFGNSAWGQTGLSHYDNVCTPQPLSMNPLIVITQVSAGARHTLFVARETGSDNTAVVDRVYACGDNSSGQCGRDPSIESRLSVAQAVQGLPAASSILFACAGADHSLVAIQHFTSTVSGSSTIKDHTHGDKWLPLELPSISSICRAAAEGEETVVINKLHRVFGNPAFLLDAFENYTPSSEVVIGELQQEDGDAMDVDQQQQPASTAATTKTMIILDAWADILQAVMKANMMNALNALANNTVLLLERIEAHLAAIRPRLDQQLEENTINSTDRLDILKDLEWVPKTLFVLFQSPLNQARSGVGRMILLRIALILTDSIPPLQRVAIRRQIIDLLQHVPKNTFALTCRAVQTEITNIVQAGRFDSARLEVMMLGILLDILVGANESSSTANNKVPMSEFANEALSNRADLQAEYLTWIEQMKRHPGGKSLVSFCQLPFILTPEAKNKLIRGEAMMEKQHHVSLASMQAFFQGIDNPADVAFLQLNIRRTHIVEDALSGLMYNAEDLKKPLKVRFITDGVEEPAVDEGGVTKELFQLLSRDLFKPEYGMFTYNDATRTYWFNQSSLEGSETEYRLVGALLGLAIYNGVLIDARLPLVVYKKLLGKKPTFEDLKESFPDLAKGLQALLDYEPAADVEDVFCINFTAEYDNFGESKVVELLPNGADIPVNDTNRAQYVRLYTQWYLEDSIKEQFNAFKSGFLQVIGGPALSLLNPKELERQVIGLPHLDFHELEAAAKYEGYDKDSQVIKWFWQVVQSMDLKHKKMLLIFITGSDRSPIGGLRSLSLTIQRAGVDSGDRLPTSHTCFNTLLLPEYSSFDKLKERLTLATENASVGFGLQ